VTRDRAARPRWRDAATVLQRVATAMSILAFFILALCAREYWGV